MKTSVEKLEGSNIKLTVTVDAKDVDGAIDGVYASVANQIKIAGFRKGKAPRPVIDSHVGRDYVLQEATETVINDSYPLALDAEGLRPIDSPKIGEMDPVKPGEDFTYSAELLNRPELDLSSYDDISVELPPGEATEREIDAQIDYMRERFAAVEPVTDRGIAAEDFVLLSFVGLVDGEPYEGNAVDKYLYEMNRGLMPVEFDRGLIGLKAGDETRIEFPIPESSSVAEFIGKTATFDVTVHEVKEKVLPPVDDEFAGNVGGYDTVEDLRKDLREKMDAQKAIAQMQLKEREARGELAKRLEGDVPEPMIESRKDAILRDFVNGLESRELTLEGYLATTGVDFERLQEDMKVQAVESLREELALEALFRALEMEVTDEDLDAEMAEIVGEDKDVSDFRKRLEEAGSLTVLREQVMQKKAMLWLLDHVKVVEKDPLAEANAEVAAEEAAETAEKKAAPKKRASRAKKKKTEDAPNDTTDSAELLGSAEGSSERVVESEQE